jgi:hypothetical protein
VSRQNFQNTPKRIAEVYLLFTSIIRDTLPCDVDVNDYAQVLA